MLDNISMVMQEQCGFKCCVRSLQRIGNYTRSVSSVSLSNILFELTDEASFVLLCSMHIYTSIHIKRTKVLLSINYQKLFVPVGDKNRVLIGDIYINEKHY